MKYFIKDQDCYIGYTDNRFCVVKERSEAATFNSEMAGNNVINNSLSATVKVGRNWKCFPVLDSESEKSSRSEAPIEPIKEKLPQEVVRYVIKNESGYFSFIGGEISLNSSFEDAFQFKYKVNCERILQALNFFDQSWTIIRQSIEQKPRTLNKDLKKAEQYRVEIQYQTEPSQLDEFMLELLTMYTVLEEEYSNLQEQQAVVEAEIIDFQHAIEFYDLNASEGFRAYKNLQQALRKRRKLKNDFKKVTVLKNTCLNENIIETLQAKYPETNQYHYVPRVLTGLFKESDYYNVERKSK